MELATKHKLVTAIVGSYRKGGVVDTAVDEILDAARKGGAQTEKIYLVDRHIEFCTNCRSCTQKEGTTRGECCLRDEMCAILDTIERSDGIVLASPVNFFTVTAVMKRFIERLVCFTFWPWGSNIPRARNPILNKRAVIVASSAAPAFIGRLASKMIGLLKRAAGLLGAKTVGILFIGLAARQPRQEMGVRTRRRATRLGKKLVCAS